MRHYMKPCIYSFLHSSTPPPWWLFWPGHRPSLIHTFWGMPPKCVNLLPIQTMHYYRQITQKYHTFVLLGSPNVGSLMTPVFFCKVAIFFTITNYPRFPTAQWHLSVVGQPHAMTKASALQRWSLRWPQLCLCWKCSMLLVQRLHH